MHPKFSASILLAASLVLLAACGTKPADSAYNNRGGPESLLDVSSEVVSLPASNKTEQKDLTAWIEKDHPTRAQLNCNLADKNCDTTRKILDKHNVPVAQGANNDQSVTLVYERILARDCDQRMDFHQPNYYNTNYNGFGCSVAANMVQEVTDKQELINPSLSDDPRATRAVTDYHRAYAPRQIVGPYDATESIVNKAKTQ